MTQIRHPYAAGLLSDFLNMPCCLADGSTPELVAPSPGEVCVALGTGPGISFERLSNAVGADGFVYGVEPAKKMLRQAEQRTVGMANVELLNGLFETIELEDGIADWVVSNCSLVHAQDKARVWQEIFRILKPGGRFAVSDLFSETPLPALRDKRKAASACLSDLMTREEYLYTLDNLDFRDVTIVEESAPYPAVYLGRNIRLASFLLTGIRSGDILSEEYWD